MNGSILRSMNRDSRCLNAMPDQAIDFSTNLYRQTCGAGRDVVLLHGWGMHSGVWEDVVEELVDDYRVTLLDLPGHGYSRGVSAVWNSSALAAELLAAVPQPATWIGWSLGGLIAQQAAVLAPQQVNRLILVNSTPCFVQKPDWAHGIALATLRRFAEELRQDYRAVLQRFLALEVHGSEHASTQLRQLKSRLYAHGEPELAALVGGLTVLESSDLRGQAAQISCPIRILSGQRDQLVPAHAGDAMLRLWPEARLHCFLRAGHAPFLSHLAEFVAQLRAFIDD